MPVALTRPVAAGCQALRELASLGYYRGIMNKLDEIEAGEPHCGAFVAQMRALARQFQFEAMILQLEPGLACGPDPPLP